MYSIRKKLSIILVICSIVSIIFTSLLVNITINHKFNKYMIDTKNKRNARIVDYFQELYKRDKKWTSESGTELMHEAYMENYCLSLLDSNKNLIWTMNTHDIEEKVRLEEMLGEKNKGVFNFNTFEIKSEDRIVGYVTIGQYSSILLSQEDLNFKTSINENIIISGVVIVFITILVSLYVSNQFSIPIKEVSNISVHLSKGNYESRSDTKSNILELIHLRDSINILGEKLKYQDLLRKRLVSDISHEIRTPLNILQNNLEAMIDGIFPVTSEQLTSLNQEVVRFGKLLDNLNALKEFEAQAISLNINKVSIDKLIFSVCEDFSVALKEKNIDLIYNIEPKNDYAIFGDVDKLRQVFINLLSNAVKFTKCEGKVWISLTKNKTHVIVKIKDNGIGIKKEDVPFIFERLYRGDKSRHEIEGSGIGLTIVKNILKLHSARIDVQSKLGEGSTFKIYLKNS